MSSSRAFPGGGGSRGQDGGYQSFGDNNSSAPPTPLPPASSSSGVGGQPTYAAFSPPSLGKNQSSSGSASAASKRSTILVHQKSPLLLATPPQITRALAYSHPFILPLNTVAGLLSWTTGDPWESFLLVCAFWALVLYGDVVIRLAGPVVVVLVLIAGMYSRRWSPLSSRSYEVSREAAIAVGDKASKSGKGDAATDDGKLGHRRGASMAAGTGAQGEKDRDGGGSQAKEAKTSSHTRTLSNLASTAASAANPAEATPTRHQKTLDSMVATLKEFTHRCGLLLEPLLELTDFLSTQRTPTTASTRPALTTLFIRILFCTPVWIILTLPPWRIITTRRVVLFVGTVALTWHARAMRVARTIVWRSLTVRRLAALVTGLEFEMPKAPGSGSAGGPNEKDGVAADKLAAGSSSAASAKAAASGSTTSAAESELTKALRRRDRKSHSRMGSGASNGDGTRDSGVRFTFIIYENQRRWVGLGWTSSLFAYERPAWTDEHNNPVPPRDDFELPSPADTHVGGAGGKMRWRWVRGSRWKVDGVPDAPDGSGNQVDVDGEQGRMGWIYYDNKVCGVVNLAWERVEDKF